MGVYVDETELGWRKKGGSLTLNYLIVIRTKLLAFFSEIYFIITCSPVQAQLKTFCSDIQNSLYSEVSILCSILVTTLYFTSEFLNNSLN